MPLFITCLLHAMHSANCFMYMKSFNCAQISMAGGSVIQAMALIFLCFAISQHLGQCLRTVDTQIYIYEV